jgi:proteasome accessory factor C
MAHQNKILRVLQLIVALQSRLPKTMEQLSEIIGSGTRTVYRYFELLEEIGFRIEKDNNGRYSIKSNKVMELSHFTDQEFKHLSKLLHTADRSNPLNRSILNKMAVRSDVQIATVSIGKAHLSRMVEDIQEAIDNQKQIIIKCYHSISSQSITDRIVEPISIDNNYRTITAFEVSSGINKTFVVERMQNVEITNVSFKHKEQHLIIEKDVFGFGPRADQRTFPVHLELSLKAKILLSEEYPKTEEFITQKPNSKKYVFQCHINDPRPLERFMMGLPDEVKVLKGHEVTDKEYNLI